MIDRRGRWWKSSYSNTPNNGCVEVGDLGTTRGIGDTTHRSAGYLEFTPADFQTFIEAVKTN